MTNDQMKPNRFAIWAKARFKLAWINARLDEGRTVYLCTCTKATKITGKHRDLIKATKSGLYVQHGRKWLCYDGADLKAS